MSLPGGAARAPERAQAAQARIAHPVRGEDALRVHGERQVVAAVGRSFLAVIAEPRQFLGISCRRSPCTPSPVLAPSPTPTPTPTPTPILLNQAEAERKAIAREKQLIALESAMITEREFGRQHLTAFLAKRELTSASLAHWLEQVEAPAAEAGDDTPAPTPSAPAPAAVIRCRHSLSLAWMSQIWDSMWRSF